MRGGFFGGGGGGGGGWGVCGGGGFLGGGGGGGAGRGGDDLLTTTAIVSFRVLDGPECSSSVCFSGARLGILLSLCTDMVFVGFCEVSGGSFSSSSSFVVMIANAWRHSYGFVSWNTGDSS